MNEDGRAAGKEQEETPINSYSKVLYLTKPGDGTEIQIAFCPTWIHSSKEHVEKDSCQKDSLERE